MNNRVKSDSDVCSRVKDFFKAPSFKNRVTAIDQLCEIANSPYRPIAYTGDGSLSENLIEEPPYSQHYGLITPALLVRSRRILQDHLHPASLSHKPPDQKRKHSIGYFCEYSHRITAPATSAPANCARMNAGASTGRMPAKVSLAVRANVTAGFANEVDAVNQ